MAEQQGATPEELVLTEPQKSAIRTYMLTLITLPGIVLTILAFLLGFLVDKAARESAFNDAFSKNFGAFSSKFTEMIEKAAQANLQAEGAKRQADAVNTVAGDTLPKLLAAVARQQELEQRVQTIQTFVEGNSKLENLEGKLLADEGFKRKVAEQVVESQATENHGFIRFGDLQLCWNLITETPKYNSSAGVNILSFKVPFEKNFSVPPVVNISVNGRTSGYAYAVYSHTVTVQDFVGNAIEVMRRNTTEPVDISMIAIGRWR